MINRQVRRWTRDWFNDGLIESVLLAALGSIEALLIAWWATLDEDEHHVYAIAL